MNRFYKTSSYKKTDEGFTVQLDGKTIKTPSGQDLCAPSSALADAIVLEWSSQTDNVNPETMPLTQILTTAIDKMRERNAITQSLMKYLDTDLLCYRTKEPKPLSDFQKEKWDPWLSWFDEHFEVPLDTTKDLKVIKQDEEAHKRVWNYIEALDEYYFTILHIVTSLTGSLVLGLAFVEEAISPDETFEAAHVEETYHSDLADEKTHGKDPSQEKSQKVVAAELQASKRFLELINE